MGGTVALEIAQQLTAKGATVSLVILLETYNPSKISRVTARFLRPVHFVQNLWFHTANAILLSAKDRWKFLSEKASVQMTRMKIRVQSFDTVAPDKKHETYPHLKIKQTNDEANMNYVPRMYDGRVVVVSPTRYFVGEADPNLGWSGRIMKGLKAYHLPLYPRGMLVEPFCRRLAETLNQCLRDG